MKLFLLIAALLLAPTFAAAQAFNVDAANPFLGDTIPSGAYGAAASQTGVWNYGYGVPTQLRTTDGSLTSATFGSSGGAEHLNIQPLIGDEKRLMESCSTMNRNDSMGFRTLGSGPYDLYVYMWGGPLLGTKTVTCSVFNGISYADGSVSYTNQWPGSQIQGVTYAKIRVDVLPSYQYLSMNFSWFNGQPADFTIVNGLQLVPVPTPGASALLLGAGTLALRRRR